jgi:hypothetical protein
MTRKVLWSYDPDQAGLLDKARTINASAVCIRTDLAWLPAAIPQFKQHDIAVYGWRWPAIRPTTTPPPHYYADDEANYVVTELIPSGLAGYIVDAESDGPKAPEREWDSKVVDTKTLAATFCKTIKDAGMKAIPTFLFGMTSGGTYPKAYPQIPWAEFVAASQALYPQVYWYKDKQQYPGRSTPQDSYNTCIPLWQKIAAGKPLIPIIGEIASVTSQEIASYSAIITANKLTEVHMYTYDGGVSLQNWTAMKNL